MLADDTIRAVLRTSWHLQPDGFSRLAGGMTSTTWLVSAGARSYVAKLVPYAVRGQFEAGLTAAEHLTNWDLDAGAPVRAIDGRLSFPIEGYVLGLLRFVQGRPLDRADPVDQLWWGDRLGAAHRLLANFSHPGLPEWHGLRPDAPHLALEAWVRPAVTRAITELERLQVTDRLTFGTLHGDPHQGSFLLDRNTGRIGIIDWGAVTAGPLMYDVASAVMYAGGPDSAADLLQAYAATGVVPKAEMESALPVLLRFRWAVQADFFAGRLIHEASDENRKGLRDARKALTG